MKTLRVRATLGVVLVTVACTARAPASPGVEAASGSSSTQTLDRPTTEEDGWACGTDPVRLFDAALSNDTRRIRKILRRCAPDADKTVQDDIALQRAAYSGAVKAVSVLVAFGADPEYDDADGRTALMYAGQPSLEFAEHRQDPEKTRIARRLLKSGARVNRRNDFGGTALQAAAGGGLPRTVGVLLRNGAAVNAKQDGRITALMMAASQGKRSVVIRLLRVGARTRLRDSDGKTAADRAREAGYPKLARRIDQAG